MSGIKREAGTCAHASAGHDAASRATVEALRELFPPGRLKYVLAVLTPGELSVVADPADALIIARIKRMPPERLHRFDALQPAAPQDWRLYHTLQLRWLRDEEYLLGTRLGRRPTHRELFVDFMSHHNGVRFRAYFALKYPQRVRPAEQRPPRAP